MTTSTSFDMFEKKYSKSKKMFQRSLNVSRGMNHDSRQCDPFPIIASHAEGSRKWDIDGNAHIDYSMGHAALLFGHSHPTIVNAVSKQMARGTLFAHESEISIELAERVAALVPAAESVEFTSSGNEANLLTAQIARAYTKRFKILKFEGDDFGWTDEMNVGSAEPYDKPRAGRVPPLMDGALTGGIQVVPRNDIAALEQALEKNDVAALFVEGAEAHATGSVASPETIQAARTLTTKYGALLIFDEVITGFRFAPGGWQSLIGITPDMCSLAKVLGGGLPIGAVCGSAEVMGMLRIKVDDPEWNRFQKVPHAGSYNGNGVSAAAGNAVLEMVATGDPQRHADAMTERLCNGFNLEGTKYGLGDVAFHRSSMFHLRTAKFANPLLRHMLLNGVHIHRGTHGWVSAVHSTQDIDDTVAAFGKSLGDLSYENEL